MSSLKEFEICPYNSNHIMSRYRVQNHIPGCKKQYQNVFSLTCRFSCQRLSKEDSEFMCEAVPKIVSSKSKRRRVKIRERRAKKVRKPRNNEPSRNSGLNEKAVKMGDEQETSDPWQESVKKRSPKKYPSQFRHFSKSAKKRSQKKLRGKRTAKASQDARKDGPVDKYNENKEYVIKLKDSVTVTETNKSHKEVYIHYPTRKVLPAGTVPKSGLGIQPMMLQRICYEAFMKTYYSSDGEGSGVSSANEDENKINRAFQGIKNRVTQRVNEKENKTIQDSQDTKSRFAQSSIMKGKKTTKASCGKRNAALHYPIRSKSKRNKKKRNENPKTAESCRNPAPHSPVKHPSVEELECRELYAKYMLFDNQELPPAEPCSNPRGYPPAYLEVEDTQEREESELSDNSAEHEVLEINEYLRHNEQSSDYENRFRDEEADDTDNSPDDYYSSDGNPVSPDDYYSSEGNPASPEDVYSSDDNPISPEDEYSSDDNPISPGDEYSNDDNPNSTEEKNGNKK